MMECFTSTVMRRHLANDIAADAVSQIERDCNIRIYNVLYLVPYFS